MILASGQGNYNLMSFDHTKTARMKNELPLVDYSFLALLSGKELNVGSVNVPYREILTVDGSNQASLASTPVSGTLKLYLLSNTRDNGTEQTAGVPATTQNTYSISGTTVTFNATTCPLNTQVIATYSYAGAATMRQVTFTADVFPGYFRIVGAGKVTDQVDGNTYITKFDIKKAKPQNNYTLTMKSTEATKLNITWDLYPVDVTTSGTTNKVYAYFQELV
jgi:hypothetical protein